MKYLFAILLCLALGSCGVNESKNPVVYSLKYDYSAREWKKPYSDPVQEPGVWSSILNLGTDAASGGITSSIKSWFAGE